MMTEQWTEVYDLLQAKELKEIFGILWKHAEADKEWFANTIVPFIEPCLANVSGHEKHDDYDSFDEELERELEDETPSIQERIPEPERIQERIPKQDRTPERTPEHNTLTQIIKNMTDEIKIEIRESAQRKKYTSKTKGTDAEDIMEDIIKENWDYERSSDKAHQGDFIIKLELDRTYRILVDIKNYKGVIPSKEYDKFAKDIETTGCDGGIYYAYEGTITGYKKCISIGKTITGVPVVMVQNSPEETIGVAIDILRAQLIINEKNTLEDTDKIKTYADIALIQTNALGTIRQNISECTNTLNKAQVEIEISIMKIRTAIEGILGSIKDDEPNIWKSKDIKEIVSRIMSEAPKLSKKKAEEIEKVIERVCMKIMGNNEGELEIKCEKGKIKVGTNIEIKIASREQRINIESRGKVEADLLEDGWYIEGQYSYELRYKNMTTIEKALERATEKN